MTTNRLPATPNIPPNRWHELVPLGVGADLDAAEQAELDAILAENADARAEFAAFEDALAPLRLYRHLDPQPMPAHLADRITANVMAAIMAPPTLAHLPAPAETPAESNGEWGTTGAADDGMPDAGASPILWINRMRHPAVAAMLILALGLGLLLVPNRSNPSGPLDPSANSQPDAGNPPSATNQPNTNPPIDNGSAVDTNWIPVPLPAELPRNIDGEAVNAVNTRSTLEMGFPYGMRSIDSDREAGRVKSADARDAFADPTLPNAQNGRGQQFRLPQSDIAPDDANVIGDF